MKHPEENQDQIPVSSREVGIKSIILIVCVTVGLVAGTLIVMNIADFVGEKNEQERLAAEKIAQEKQEREAIQLAAQQQAERERVKVEFATVKQDILSRAETLADAGQYQEARDLLRDYHGKFADETYQMRMDLSYKYAEQQEKIIRGQRQKVMASVVGLLLKQDYAAARKALDAYPLPIPSELSEPITELANADKTIADTFVKDIDGIVVISLKNGETVTAKLEKIDGTTLVIEQSGQAQKVAVRDINIMERANRLGFLSQTGKALYLGADAWSRDAKPEAAASFKKLPEVLASEIFAVIGNVETNEESKDARLEFFKILRQASLISDDIDNDYISEKLKDREVALAEDRNLKTQLDAFVAKYGQTLFAKKYEKAIGLIRDYLNEKVDYLEFVTGPGISKSSRQVEPAEYPPGAFWEVAPSKNKRLYAKLNVGKYNSINIVIEKASPPQAFFAIDDDIDFTGKRPVLIDRWQSVTFLCKYQGKPVQKYAVEFKYSPLDGTLSYRTGCKRVGKVMVGKELYEFTLIDHEVSTDYSTDKTAVSIKTIGKKGQAVAIMDNAFSVNGETYRIESVDSTGTHVNFKKKE